MRLLARFSNFLGVAVKYGQRALRFVKLFDWALGVLDYAKRSYDEKIDFDFEDIKNDFSSNEKERSMALAESNKELSKAILNKNKKDLNNGESA